MVLKTCVQFMCFLVAFFCLWSIIMLLDILLTFNLFALNGLTISVILSPTSLLLRAIRVYKFPSLCCSCCSHATHPASVLSEGTILPLFRVMALSHCYSSQFLRQSILCSFLWISLLFLPLIWCHTVVSGGLHINLCLQSENKVRIKLKNSI